MRLSRTVGYAVLAVAELASAPPNAIVPSRKLAAAGNIPDRFLLQILRSLVARGVLRSTRGVVGGYSLARRLEDISLLDVIEAVEGPIRFELPAASSRRSAMDEEMRHLGAQFRGHLASIKLSQLANRSSARHGAS